MIPKAAGHLQWDSFISAHSNLLNFIALLSFWIRFALHCISDHDRTGALRPSHPAHCLAKHAPVHFWSLSALHCALRWWSCHE